MPYIQKTDRDILDKLIDPLIDQLVMFNNQFMTGIKSNDELCGQLNYIISRLCWQLSGYKGKGVRRYARMNAILGVLEASKLEFYRRIVVTYEDEKIKENGDI